ncbi:MAG TPA: choice-of-anchor D domain-containing protein [Solirubrobacterales bacterium]|nr:choice-of-anchor D domain-containing protein [Solirubrobacterales bacterium]
MKRAVSTWAVFAFATIVAVALAVPSFASALSFQATSQSPLPEMTGAADVAAGNFNADSDTDLAVADESGVVVWLANGDGTFTKGQTLPIDSAANATAQTVVAGDFNGDGKEDLAYTDGPYKLYIALGKGNGTFEDPDASTKLPLPFFVEAGELAVGDFHDDHKDDLVLTGGIHSPSFESSEYQIITDENGTFTQETPVPVSIPEESLIVGVAVGDYTGSGEQDLALLSRPFSESNYADNQIYGEVGKGDGTFTPATANPISLGLTESGFVGKEATADLNGGGGDDLLIATGVTNALTSEREFSTVPLLGSSSDFLTLNTGGALEEGLGYGNALAAADVTGSGRDAAITGYFDGDGSFGVGLSDTSGNLTEAPGSPFSVGEPHFFDSAIAVGDFNGDGSPDIAIASDANTNGGPLTQGVAVMINSPELSVSPTSLDFGEVEIGQTEVRKVTLTGLGGPDAEVSGLEFSGSPGNPFSVVDPTACATVAYEEECEVEVEYAPTTREASNETLFVKADTGPGGSDGLTPISLTGQGTGPSVLFIGAGQEFGSAVIGGTPVTRSVTIQSTGNAPLTVTEISLSSESDFKLAGQSACMESIPPTKTCSFNVSFNPTTGAPGPRSAALTIRTSGGGETASLLGTAEAPPSTPGGGGGAPSPMAKLKLKAPATIEAGKTIKLKAQVTNTGAGPISGLMLNTTASKKLAKPPAAVRISSLAAGKSVTETIKVKVKSGASAGKKLKLTVSASAGGKTLATASKKVKID